ncbi:MAG: hypothetical protein MUF25_21115 [Pirellulaceae bacterium]|nr:hypothetical protein [Pirellulaceae bacterium]
MIHSWKAWKRACLAATTVAAVGVAALAIRAQETNASKPDRALERTRKTVRMLDDIYKAAVVLITDKYVNDEDDFPAGSAAIALFDAVKQKNWHEVKLLDVRHAHSRGPAQVRHVPRELQASQGRRAHRDAVLHAEDRVSTFEKQVSGRR